MPKAILITGSSFGFSEAKAELFPFHGWNVAAAMCRPHAGAALVRLRK